MKRGLWIFLVAVLAGVIGFAAMHRAPSPSVTTSAHEGSSLLPELDWLRREFNLSDEQFAATAELHLAYRPTCEELCLEVMASHEKIEKLVDSGTQVTPELEAALHEHAALHVECQTAMLGHLYRTAACLPPSQAKRYLDVMLPLVIEMAGEPDPQLDGH